MKESPVRWAALVVLAALLYAWRYPILFGTDRIAKTCWVIAHGFQSRPCMQPFCFEEYATKEKHVQTVWPIRGMRYQISRYCRAHRPSDPQDDWQYRRAHQFWDLFMWGFTVAWVTILGILLLVACAKIAGVAYLRAIKRLPYKEAMGFNKLDGTAIIVGLFSYPVSTVILWV